MAQIDQQYEDFYLRRIAEIQAGAEKRVADLTVKVTQLQQEVAILTAENDEMKSTSTEMALRAMASVSEAREEDHDVRSDREVGEQPEPVREDHGGGGG